MTATPLEVQALWRYPVTSLGGERLDEALLTPDGVEGDRRVHVAGPHGPLTGRTRAGLLTVPASTGPALDARRLRPDLVLAGVAGLDSAAWPGAAALAVGEALVGVHSRRPRCIVTATDPDTGDQDLDVFRRIRRDARDLLGLDCWVIRPGTVRVGDPVRVVPSTARPPAVGGWIVGAPYRGSDGVPIRQEIP